MDNSPRNLLMYFSNVAYPLESYFHTVICNSADFQNTTVDNDLSYIIWDTTHGEANVLNKLHYDKMVASGTVFARPFQEGDRVLNKIDNSVLNRLPNGLVPGEWCLDKGMNRSTETSKQHEEFFSTWGNINAIKPGSYGIKLGVLLSELAREGTLSTSPCRQQSESRNITRTMRCGNFFQI